MARKLCPICYFEFDEKVGLKTNGINRSPNGRGNSQNGNRTEYKCKKRGHILKGPGLSVAELEKLHTFRKLEL